MKVFYVPFNNKGLKIERREEESFVEDMLDVVEKFHVLEGDKGVIFIYVSDPENSFASSLSKKEWPKWLLGMNIVVRKNFSESEAESMALELAGDSESVVEFRPMIPGIDDIEDVDVILRKQRSKWSWAYAAEIGEE